MPSVDPAAALAAGTLIVTPNKRLARALRLRHDAAQVAAGAAAWPAARTLPWPAWLAQLWQDALAEGALPAPQPLLTPAAAAFLWDRIAASSGNLLDARGAAVAAADAWRTLHAWRHLSEGFDAWRHAGISDDVALFAAWAGEFAATLRAQDRLDMALLPDTLAPAAARVRRWRGMPVVLAGFLELSPQQQRLLTALRAGGMTITELALPRPRAGAQRHRVACASAADELRNAMAQARAWALASPSLDIGLVFGDLRERRAEIRAAADDILVPEIAARVDPDVARPYNLSLGEPLLDVPLVSTAMALLAWSAAPLPIAAAAALLRARHLPRGGESWSRRAALERRWRADGVAEVTFGAMLAVLPDVDPSLAEHWRRAMPPESGRNTPAAWADAWRAWLAALGWPGDESLGSAEWQARDAFWRALGEFATLGDVAGPLVRGDAVATLRAALAHTLFQPDVTGARIHILGTLEASGLEFDRLWLAGMSATRWPGSAAPNPLLPLAWQRERGVPRADARRLLHFAQAATAAFASAADRVVASHSRLEDDAPAAVSALIADWPEAPAPAGPMFAGQAAALAAARPAMESVGDAAGPPLPPGSHAGGGAGVIEAQSECAFRAFARYRLRIPEWPGENVGLAPNERGGLLHRAMAAFWAAVGDHAQLCVLDAAALRREVGAAVAVAVAAVDARRWRALPAPVAAAETERLGALMGAWLDGFERARPPFVVRDREVGAELALGELAFRLRIDRVDELRDGGVAIIDYKSGHAPGAAQWFQARPAGTQLGLYALALRAARPDEAIRAVAYARLKAGDIGVVGLTADLDAWPGVPDVAARRRLPVASWAEVETFWRNEYGVLARAFRTGQASVDPRSGDVCARCDMQALCRIERGDGQDEGEGDDDRDDRGR